MDLSQLLDLLPLLIPLLIIQLGLLAFALRDLMRKERRVKGGSKLIWGIVIVFFDIIGPVVYFLFGRED